MSRFPHNPASPSARRPGAGRRRRDHPPELITSIRSALRSDHPLPLLLLAAGLVEATDIRNRNPFTPDRSDGPGISELIGSFANVDLPETTAVLTAMAPLLEGKPGSASIRQELRRRTHRLPAWLTSLTPLRVTRVMTTTHPFHDGEDVFVEALTDGGHSFTVAVYIDHNLGTLIKDAFVIPTDIDAVRAILLNKTDDPEIVMAPLDPADARARIEAAADAASRTFPPFESDTWPLCRPLVELVARLLPGGGEGYRFTEWSDAARGDLEQRFLASPHAANLDADQRDLVDPLLWVGCDYGIGEPLNWSPTRAEIFLLDWVPRKLLVGRRVLRKIPALLRAFVAFGHEQIGLRDDLTAETLRAIEHFGPAYQTAITGPRSTGPLGLLERAGIFDIQGASDPGWDPLEHLDRQVGGRDALDALHDRPLPDDPFRWEGVPEDVHPTVSEVLERCDAFCDRWLEVEHRTAVRRLLAMVAAADPGVFQGSGRVNTAAAALCWIVGKANGVFDQRWGSHGSMLVKDLMGWFGLIGSPSNRAARMLRAVGVDDRWFAIWSALGDPDLLVSRRRASILMQRELVEQQGR
ncbi:MAG TPA: DUF6398 domain-containing protein [Acidimicrobiia bacterium]|nr:DUF6398 domain-containing protein [Acidimicrobiia bacterium]